MSTIELLQSLTSGEIGKFLQYLLFVKESRVRRIPESVDDEIRRIIQKLEGAPDLFFGDINQWIDSNLPGITYSSLLNEVVGYSYTKELLNWKQDMISRSTPLTEDEIEQYRKTGISPRTVDVLIANGKDGNGNKIQVYLTKFGFQVNYVDGMQKITMTGGKIITPPSIFDVMNSLTDQLKYAGDILNHYNARKDNYLGQLATSTDIDPNWEMPELLYSSILNATEYFANNISSLMQKLLDIKQNSKLSDEIKSDMQKYLGIPGGILYNTKYYVYSGFALIYLVNSIFNFPSTAVAARKVLSTNVETITRISKKMHDILHVAEHQLHNFKELKAILSPGIGSSIFGEDTIAGTAFDFSLVWFLGRFGTRGTWIGIGIDVLWGIYKYVKKKITASEKLKGEQEFLKRGLVPDGANYDLNLPMSQFGMLASPALHRIFKMYEEYTDEFGRIIRGDSSRIRYTSEGKTYFDYPWNYELFNSGDPLTMLYPDGTRGAVPDGYTGPLTFFPITEVTALNEGILNTIKQSNKLPKGANPEIPIFEITKNDIPDLFEPGWHTGNYDWLSAAEDAVKAGNLNKENLNTVKNFNKFVEETTRTVLLPDGNLTINFGFLDEMEYSNLYMRRLIEQFDDNLLPMIQESDSVGLTKIATTYDGVTVKVITRTEQLIDMPNGNRTNVSKKAATKTNRKNPKIKKKTPIQSQYVRKTLPRPPKNQNGRILTQSERNERRSKSLGLGMGDIRDIESVINTKIPAKSAPTLKTSPTGGGPTSGGRRIVTSEEGTTSGAGGGGVIETTCFPSYVGVKTLHGYVSIGDIQVGDHVISFDENKIHTESIVTHKFIHDGEERSEVYRYFLSNNTYIDITKNHSVLTMGNQFKQIGNLFIGDSLVYDGDYVSIIGIDYLGFFDVYNIEVENNHTYIANGVYVHNALKNDPRSKDYGAGAGRGPIIEGSSDIGGGGGTGGGETGGGTGGGETGGGTGGGETGGGTGGGETGGGKPGGEITCFPSWMKISTPNGFIEIKDTNIGDEVYSFDTTGNIHISKISHIKHHDLTEKTEVFRYKLSNGIELDITDNHGVLNKNNEFVAIGSIGIGGYLILEDGTSIEILSKDSIGIHDVYNISTENYGTYFANGIRVSGDWYP